MHRTFLPVLEVASLLLCLSISSPAEEPTRDPLQLLRATAMTYETLESFEFQGQLRGSIPGVDGTLSIPTVNVRASAKFLPADFPIPQIPEVRRFLKAVFLDSSGDAMREPPPPVSGGLAMPAGIAYFDRSAIGVKRAERIGTETLQIEGSPVECEVIEVEYEDAPHRRQQGLVRYWIDPGRLIILQQRFSEPSDSPSTGQPQVTLDWTYTVTSARLNEPPPQWALDMADRMVGRERMEWRGRRAPAFTLTDVDGRSATVPATHAVVLEFWATWCGPCSDEMRVVESIKDDYASRGVEFLGVTDEEPQVAMEWLARHGLALRTLIDTSRSVFEQYEVEPIPAIVIITPDGVVSTYLEGLHNATMIRRALDAALTGP